MTDESATLDSARDIRDNARGIMQMVAFQHWRQQVEGQALMNQGEALSPSGGFDGLVKGEYARGYLAGLLHAVKQWEYLIEHCETQIRQMQKNEEDQDNV